MDYKKVLRLHNLDKLSSREIARICNCGKTSVNDFIARFNAHPELSYPIPEDITNEFIEQMLYRKPGNQVNEDLYRSFSEEAVYRALSKKGETLKHLWQQYNAVGEVDGKKPFSYRQYCRRYSAWLENGKITFHIPRYPGINMELYFAGKTLKLHSRNNPEETTKVTIFVSTLSYSNYIYAEGMVSCDITNWIRVNNNALNYFGGVTQTVTPDNCKVAVTENKDWIEPTLNADFQAWADHNGTVITPARVKVSTVETKCGRSCKDRYHAHSGRDGKHGLLYVGRTERRTLAPCGAREPHQFYRPELFSSGSLPCRGKGQFAPLA